MKNAYRQGFEGKHGGVVHPNGSGWMRAYILNEMIMAPGALFTRQYVIELIEKEMGSRIDKKTAGQILLDIDVGTKNSKVFSIRCFSERSGKTKVPVNGYRLNFVK